MEVASLGSGSRGNATVVRSGATTVLVDCGFPCAQIERRLSRLHIAPGEVTGILVTHEHADHIRGADVFSRKHRVPVRMTPGTHHAWGRRGYFGMGFFHAHEPFEWGDLRITPFPVPHDAREPCQFVLEDGGARLGVLTDTGSITPHITRLLDGCHGLLLECNHDPRMLVEGPYPPRLQARVGGALGHLSNHQARDLLGRLRLPALRHIVAMHLSEKNNTPDLAVAAIACGLGCSVEEVTCADQTAGFGWLRI